MKKIIIGSLVAIAAMMFTGCSVASVKSGNQAVADLSNTDKYVIGKTTLAEALQELGATAYIFEKDDGQVKYAWISDKNSIGLGVGAFVPFVGDAMTTEIETTTLVLTFDKQEILVKKLFETGTYQDPDVVKMQNKVMQQYTNNLK